MTKTAREVIFSVCRDSVDVEDILSALDAAGFAVVRKEPTEEMLDRLKGWRDPNCPKCGITLSNKMMYACGHAYCPVGLN